MEKESTASYQKTYKFAKEDSSFFNISLEHEYRLNGAKSIEININDDEIELRIKLDGSSITKKIPKGQTFIFDLLAPNGMRIDTYDFTEV